MCDSPDGRHTRVRVDVPSGVVSCESCVIPCGTLGRIMRDSPNGRHARGRGDVAGCTAYVAAQHARRMASGGDLARCHPWCVRRARFIPLHVLCQSIRVSWSDQVRGEHDASAAGVPLPDRMSQSESPGPIKFAANMMPVEAGVPLPDCTAHHMQSRQAGATTVRAESARRRVRAKRPHLLVNARVGRRCK